MSHCHGLPLGNLSLDKQPRTGDLWVQSPVSFPTRPKYNYHPALPSKHYSDSDLYLYVNRCQAKNLVLAYFFGLTELWGHSLGTQGSGLENLILWMRFLDGHTP